MIVKYEDYKLDSKSVFERVTFKPPFKPNVTYENEACFIYSMRGEGVSYGGLEKDDIESLESIFMKCGSFINHWKSSKGDKLCKIIAIHFTPEILKIVYNEKLPVFLNPKQSASKKIFQKINQSDLIDEFMKGLNFYFDNPFLINEELICLKIKELILLLYNTDYPGIRELMQTLFNPVDLSFKSVILSHLFDDLDTKDFAALTNTSESTFKRKFKQIFKDSPINYISNKRLEKSAELLKISTLRITDICFDCGFNSISSFTRAFNKKYGMSPSEFRKSH